MPASKAQQRAVNKYMAANYDRINLTMPKGRKAAIQTAAADAGESVNAYINGAVDMRMEAPGAPAGGGGIQLSPDTLRAAQEAAEAAGEDVATFIARAVKAQAEQDRSAKAVTQN